MTYIVFARKYRPKNFDEITGQSHITTTLKNAIEQSKVAHAYLFAGPRGVGKTTTARILAKALNCEKGPTPKPCGKCASCHDITSGSSLDIFEIDGASSRGIDEIRSLRENAKFTPSRDRFKVYIIDEVHMLSNEAFNALLKTLEEPPPHVKFIFATTHAHKVLPTILSRCQRFDFRRIPARDILDNLKHIAKEEKIVADEAALSLIAKYSDGSMRDAQVVLDQIASFVKGKVGVDDVAKILGIVDDEILFGLSGAMHNKDPKSALKIVDELVADGKDVMQVVLGLIEHFRNISIAKVAKELDSLIDAGSDKIERYRSESLKFTIEQMLYIIYSLSNTIDFMRKTDMARIPFEAALVKLTLNSGIAPVADILKRVEALEGKMPVAPQRTFKAASSGSELKAQPDRPHEPPFESKDSAPLQDDRLDENGNEAAAADPSVQQSANLDDILSSWTKVINYIRAKKVSIAAYLQEGDPVNIEGNVLTIGFTKESQFHKEVLESLENRKTIEAAIKETLGLGLRVTLVVTGLNAPNGRSGNAGAQGIAYEGEEGEVPGKTDEDTDPIVKKALEMFGGKLAGPANGKGRA